MQIGKAARSNGSHIKSRLKMEPHGVFKEVTKQCTNKDHYQSVAYGVAGAWVVHRVHPPGGRCLFLALAALPAVPATQDPRVCCAHVLGLWTEDATTLQPLVLHADL